MKKLIILIILLLPVTQAANIALVVKNSTNLDYVHEYRVNRVLRDMGHTVTLIDTSNYQNYDFNSFSAIVIAGRPSNVYSSEHLDNFVATLPVNSKPTIVIDSAYPDDFGWIYPGAIGTVFSNNPIYLNVVDNSTMLSGFPINTKIRAHILNKPVLNIDLSRSVLNTSASLTSSNMYSVISFAEPGILLLNGNVTTARIVFFGIVQPLYWSDEAELIFKNSVNWILNNEFIIPTQPFLGEYNLLQINLFNDGKRQFLVDLGKDGTYDKFWDPNTGFITNLYIIGQNIYAIDTNSDGIYDFVYDNGFIRGLPDLIVNSINFENEPIEGGRLNIKIILKNQGSYIARNFKCAIFFDSSLLNLMTIDVLDINQEKVLNLEIINLPRGQHEIKVVVDQENVVFESNENNNQLSKAYVISYQPNYYSESRSEGGTGSTKTTTEKPFKMIEQGDINITLPSKIELLQGEKVSVDIKLFNPLNYSIYRIYPLLDSEGLNINWYSFEPLEIQILQPNQERIIKMHVNIPEDAKIYTYKINFRFPSSSDYGTKTYNKIMYLQIKEKEKITTSTPTTTTISIQQKQQITGMLVSTIFKWTAVILGLIFLLILLWFYYPRLRKDGYIVGKGWKQKRRFL
ncbi:MAG: CARDB domain-containing protein [Candidatus Aenigmatarchaeota archaeon]